MNETPNTPATSVSMEEMVNVSLRNVRQNIRQRYQQCENRIQRSPAASVLGAVAAGYLLHRMPVRAILITQVRVLSALVPPALLLFGAAKIYEYLQRQEAAKRK